MPIIYNSILGIVGWFIGATLDLAETKFTKTSPCSLHRRNAQQAYASAEASQNMCKVLASTKPLNILLGTQQRSTSPMCLIQLLNISQ